jgi:predicted PurR-regulated permease PerM
MPLKNYHTYFFFATLLLFAFLTFLLLKPILVPFIVSVVLALVFYPVYRVMLVKLKFSGLSSFLTCCLVAIIVIAPLVILTFFVVEDTQEFIGRIYREPQIITRSFNNVLSSINSWNWFQNSQIELKLSPEQVRNSAQKLSQYLIPVLQSTYLSLGQFLFFIFIMFFSLYYLLIDGKRLVRYIILLSPLPPKYEKLLVNKINLMARTTFKNQILMSLLQGTLGGILFWLTGVSSPIILAIIMAIMAAIPFTGTAFVWIPVALIMMASGHFTSGLIIILVGTFIISFIDNFVSPRMIGGQTQLHPLLVFLSFLGGIFFFGPVGFIVGPIMVTILVVLLEIYSLEFKEQLKDYNNA